MPSRLRIKRAIKSWAIFQPYSWRWVARGTSTWMGGGGWIIGERRNGEAGEAGGLSAVRDASTRPSEECGVEKQVNKVAGGGLQNARESKRRLQTDLWTDGQYSKNSPS